MHRESTDSGKRRGARLAGVRLGLRLAALLLLALPSCQREPAGSGKPGSAIEVVSPAAPKAPTATKAFVEDREAEAPSSASAAPRVLLDAPEFELIDQTGTAFGSEALRGRVWVANFIFTRCTATCPQQTAKIAEIQRLGRRWPDWERVRLVSFTVDPERDTVERLHDYGQLHQADDRHWKFLTGTRSELFRISKSGFKLPVSEAAADASSPIMHSSRFILVDAELRIRGYYDSQSDDEFLKLLADLRSVLAEPSSENGRVLHVGRPPEIFYPVWLDARRAAQLAGAEELGVYHDFEFSDGIEASGIRFVNRAAGDAARNFKINHYDHGNGLAVADVDGDGLYDLYFVSQVGGNQLWRNLGDGRFEDMTDKAGVRLAGRVLVSASFADTDNDGDPDLFVTSTRYGNAFFVNDGHGRFRDATEESGLDYTGHSSSADFFDFDRDGRLDLFLTNVGAFTTDEIGYSGDPEQRESPYYVGLSDGFATHLFPERSERSILYRNDGNNRFRDVSADVGLVHKGWSGDATPIDVNDDGWIDLYVVNMQGNDEYYENVKGERFERRGAQTFPRSPWGAMGVKSFDYNNDGKMDLFVTNMHADMWRDWPSGPGEKQKAPADAVPPESYLKSRSPGMTIFGNAFYENQGKGRFREVSDEINAENYWPWGLSVGDLNADGFQDVFITSSMNLNFRYHVNSLLLNDRGRKFRDAEFILGAEPRQGDRTATPWFELDCSGADAAHQSCEGRSGHVVVWGALGSRSSAIFDLDDDGDLDVVTNDFNSRPMVLISNLSERNRDLHYLKILLRGTRSNRNGLGAKVQVTAEGKIMTQVCDGQSGYLSQSVLPLYFGLAAAETIEKVTVEWPSGGHQTLDGPIRANQQLVIAEEDETGRSDK